MMATWRKTWFRLVSMTLGVLIGAAVAVVLGDTGMVPFAFAFWVGAICGILMRNL